MLPSDGTKVFVATHMPSESMSGALGLIFLRESSSESQSIQEELNIYMSMPETISVLPDPSWARTSV